nr:L-Ala-D/L-amino acid epimerase-like [Ipomoea trifida]
MAPLALSLHSLPLHTHHSKPSSSKIPAVTACMAPAAPPEVKPTTTSFGFKNMMEIFTVEVQRAEVRPLNVPLLAPFAISSSRLDKVENVAIKVELSNGCVGWGEAPVFPSVTAEDQPSALAMAAGACEFLRESPGKTMEAVLRDVHSILPGHQFASVRAGVEMALIDALANSIGIPLWRLFGGTSNTITTDITIPIVLPAQAAELARKYRKQGFKILKLKVGKNLKADIEVIRAIHAAYPDCMFILDANGGYSSKEAIQVLEKLHETGVSPILFEQPVGRDDWEGLGRVSRFAKENYGVPVAADESCRSLADVRKIAEENLADVVNIKLAKVGVVGALEIIELARTSGLKLMISSMVESRLATGFAAHLAAGLGCFKFINLYSPLLLAEDPVVGCCEDSWSSGARSLTLFWSPQLMVFPP